MRFDAASVASCEAWFASPRGRFALAREQLLVDHLVSPWPRRGQKLLEIGCGPGLFLEGFWRAGFDVSGLDPSPEMLAATRRRLGRHADLHLGHAEALPFGDREYDYAALLTVLEFCDDPRQALVEALRVARKGVLVGFLNRRSLYYLVAGRNWPWQGRTTRNRMLHQARWFTWPEIWDMTVAVAGLRPLRARSVLAGPPWTWRESAPWRQFNSLLLPPGWGAYGGVALDLLGDKAMTPLAALCTEPEAG